jgi:hypothetical protein
MGRGSNGATNSLPSREGLGIFLGSPVVFLHNEEQKRGYVWALRGEEVTVHVEGNSQPEVRPSDIVSVIDLEAEEKMVCECGSEIFWVMNLRPMQTFKASVFLDKDGFIACFDALDPFTSDSRGTGLTCSECHKSGKIKSL